MIANRLTNHLLHEPGERAEVDWSGPTMHYVDMSTDEIITVYLFVGTLPYSQFSYDKYSTHPEDMPPAFRNIVQWDDDRIRNWASSIGKSTRQVIDRIFNSVSIKEQGYNPRLAVLRLSRTYTDARLETACELAISRGIKAAKLRLPKADVHDILYTDKRPLNRGIMADLASCRFVDNCSSIMLQGYTSSGKTFLGCALAKEACDQLHRVCYIRLPELLSEYADKSFVPGGRTKVLNKYTSFKVLVLDEWLIPDLPKEDIEFIFGLSERCFDTTSTIFCTLYKQEEWVKRLGSGAYAESIVEHFAYNVTWIETGDVNMRQIFSHV